MNCTTTTHFNNGAIAFSRLVEAELKSIRSSHGCLASRDEAYGVIAEEIAEFFDEVRKKRENRDKSLMLAELVQIAAVACRADSDFTVSSVAVATRDDEAVHAMLAKALEVYGETECVTSAHGAYGLLARLLAVLMTEDCPDEEHVFDDRYIQLAAAACAAAVDLDLVKP